MVDEDDTDGKTPNKSMNLDMPAEPTPKIKGDKPEAHNDTPTGRCRSSLASRWLNHAAPRKTSTPVMERNRTYSESRLMVGYSNIQFQYTTNDKYIVGKT